MVFTSTKLTGLNHLQSRALTEVFADEVERGIIVVTATTAVFRLPVDEAYKLVADAIAKLPGRAHPKASLHAVRRRLAKLVK